MNAVIAALIAAAARVGAPVVKGLLEKHVGGAAGDIGGVLIDTIAERAGVPANQIPNLSPDQIDDAVEAVESQTPELILAHVERQREANRLMLAEMDKEPSVSWMWRPAGMWLMLGCIAWYVAIRPLLNALMEALGGKAGIELGMDLGTFTTIFTVYVGLYMGGNTVIRAVKKEGK